MSPACPTSVLKTIFCVKGIDPHIKINVLARARHACAHRRVPPMSPPGGRQSKGVMLERFAGSPGSKARSALPTSHRQTRVVCTSRTRSDRAGCVAASASVVALSTSSAGMISFEPGQDVSFSAVVPQELLLVVL